MRPVLLPEGLQRAKLFLDRRIRRRAEIHLRIAPTKPRKDAVISLYLREHRPPEICRLIRIGRNETCREPRELIGTHPQRAGRIDGSSVSVQLRKGDKVQPDQPDNEDKEGSECDA